MMLRKKSDIGGYYLLRCPTGPHGDSNIALTLLRCSLISRVFQYHLLHRINNLFQIFTC